MPRREVGKRLRGRPPKGVLPQRESATAKRAWVTARLAQRGDQRFLDELGVAVNRSAVDRAGATLVRRPPGYRPPGPRPAGSAHAVAPAQGRSDRPIRDWLDVDPAGLGLGAALVTFELDSKRRQRSTFRDLRNVPGVIHLMTLVPGGGEGHRLVALVLLDGEADRRRLRERFDEAGGGWGWEDIDLRTVESALGTWRHLTRVAAERESLLRR